MNSPSSDPLAPDANLPVHNHHYPIQFLRHQFQPNPMSQMWKLPYEYHRYTMYGWNMGGTTEK